MITEEFTVTSKRLSIHENEAELTQRPELRTIGQFRSSARIGSITVTGPAADELNLGQRVKLTLEKLG